MRIRRNIKRIALWLGICLCAYPFVANLVGQKNQNRTISTYKEELRQYEKDELSQVLKDAEAYNEALYQSKVYIGSNVQTGIIHNENYEKVLSFSKTQVMGVIRIPQIEVNLPIYHGTSEAVLAIGVGHLEGSSLPVGGKNTHCVLTGHRGLPNSKLFTRLDEIKEGELFYIEVASRIMAYRVKEIQVISPEDVKCLSIKTGNDFVSLVTCTPYGINSHRLVVTGERTDYKEEQKSLQPSRVGSKREILFTVIPFAMVGIVIMKIVIERKGKRCEKK